ncbi:C40 family peptidase [Streptomyces sp. GC420]|uniref:C40 family peptidase n=1 Tax=Streptomyces sp. GC420 TaxID=2697568 RepID=UPI001415076B|nr:C40 family peptidase [Streptomyces sp. GC420]NBM17713.1 glycoside hydrolase [Streptomyces sp. GC420]
MQGKRGAIVAATALVCAVTVLGGLPGTAYAAPKPDGPSSTPSPRPSAGNESDGAAGSGDDGSTLSTERLEAVRKELDALYHEAAAATDAYNLAEEKAEKQSERIVELAKEITAGQKKLDRLKAQAGAAARAQYRTGGLPPEARLVLGDDPEDFLNGLSQARQEAHATSGLLGEMIRTQEGLQADAKDASAQWKLLEANRKKKAAARQEIRRKIAEAKALESTLEEKERERLEELEKQAQYKAQNAWLDSGVLDEIDATASKGGKAAVAYATAQIGKPYEWGAEGPKTFDCSGLTSQAWAAAGVTIPRTSQEQWRLLPRIDIKDMRPGDLIIYNKDASHVAMYVGDGAMVHAPRPGRNVTIAGAGSMPILGVVRPDK